jgi:hypothetical protein
MLEIFSSIFKGENSLNLNCVFNESEEDYQDHQALEDQIGPVDDIQEQIYEVLETNSIPNLSEDVEKISNSIFNNNAKGTRENKDRKSDMFTVETFNNKKRGRTATNQNKRKKHDRYFEDNIITKIQVHYLTFIINFINVCNPLKGERNQLKQFNHEDKRNTNSAHIKELEDSSIYDLLINIPVSDKYTRGNDDANKKITDKLSKDKDDFFNKLFKMNYIEFFDYYYNNNKPLKNIIINNKTIKLSTKTETFYELIKKIRQKYKDKHYEELILNATNKYYINKMKQRKKIE